MKRYKKIYILLGVLIAACAVTFAVSKYEEHKELISASDEIVLELSSDDVQSLSWEYNEESFAFHRDEDSVWRYDEDDAFPVDQDAMGQLLSPFQSFGVSFIIEDVEDYGQYGLEEPACSIHPSTDQQEYEILLGDYSAMDSQRYVSIGDGNVYLVQEDPLDTFSVTISDLLDRDDIPVFDTVSHITFSGTENYEITYEEEGGPSYREEDVYFTQLDGETLPLDPDKISSYLQDIRFLDTTDYVTYKATEDGLASWGLDDPELTITVDYTSEDEGGNEVSGTFVLSVSRDPEELAAAREAAQAGEETETTDTADTEEEEITAYARVGDSPIVYQITADDYTALMAASYDDLRHSEVLPAAIEDVSQLDITLDGKTYTITSLTDGESRSYYYQEELVDLTDIQNALTALTADSFTTEAPAGKKEISLTVTLDVEDSPTVQLEFYQYDGSYCLTVIDGEPVSLVARSSVVDLMEAINAIVLS